MPTRFRMILLLTLVIALLAFGSVSAQDTVGEDGRLPNGCFPPQNLVIDDIVTIIGGVYIRALPSINAGIVSYAPDRIPARVLGGPVCANGFNWWQVERQFEEPTFLGWVADRDENKIFVFPPAAVPPTPCPTPITVTIGQAVDTYEGVRVRAIPSLSGTVLTTALPDTSAIILDGPVCVEGYNWWLVRILVSGITYDGWIVEGVPTEEEANPVINPQPDAAGDPNSIPCGPPAPLQVGARGRIRYSAEPLKNLRTAPATSSEVLYTLPSGVQLEILSDAFCNQGVNWRRVRVFGGSIAPEGWIAEGDHLGRFIGPNGEDYDQPAP